MSKSDHIVPLHSTTVHLICSGQVVLNLAIAVKELIENSLDAFATHIEIRLIEYGSDAIEVVDNGCGVRQENFQALTLKHYTSKLQEFEDLASVETLGFRGEALSSLCALGKLTITTRHESIEHGTRLEFDSCGKIVSETVIARSVGTTSTIENLFSPLPVRRKEFVKNLKREFNKLCQLLHAYCLVSKGVKFTCFNRLKSGSRSAILTTEGSDSIRDNIVSIFGTKQISTLIDVPLLDPNSDILDEFNLKSFDPTFCTFEFLISNAAPLSGRSSSDRQFFYVNSRPIDFPKVSKLINSVYRQYNSNQYPFFYLNVTMRRSMVDVNVMPDKRQVFVEKEKHLLAVIKSSLVHALEKHPDTRSVKNFDCGSDQKLKQQTLSFLSQSADESMWNCMSSQSLMLSQGNKRTADEKIFNLLSKKLSFSCKNEVNSPDSEKISEEFQSDLEKKINHGIHFDQNSNHRHLISQTLNFESKQNKQQVDTLNTSSTELNSSPEKLRILNTSLLQLNPSPQKSENALKRRGSDETQNLSSKKKKSLGDAASLTLLSLDVDSDHAQAPSSNSITIRCSINYIKDALKSCSSEMNEQIDGNKFKVHFRSEIDPSANKSAEAELERRLTKDKFKKMNIIGQFNMGFIVTRLDNDLFIVDQHASDEKYNFEQLQQTTIMEKQYLVKPKLLELTAGNEELLMDNLETFQQNGFTFNIDANAPATKKIALTAIPMSKNYVFGKDDVEEMLFMLKEGVCHGVIRPSRIRSMFASRACRKSVMVGNPLTELDMRRLVDHMGEIEQPWNCPHGRPTMRHLINLKLIQND